MFSTKFECLAVSDIGKIGYEPSTPKNDTIKEISINLLQQIAKDGSIYK